MRTRIVIAVVGGLALGGCSLLISEDFAAEDSNPSANEGGATDTSANDDGGPVDPGGDGAPNELDAGSDAALDPSLVAFWTFDQPHSGVIPDQTGHGHTLVLTGAAQIVAGAGVRGAALVMTGNGQFAAASSLAGPAFPTSGTFSVWLKYDWEPTDLTDRGVLDDWDNMRSHVFLRKNEGTSFQAALQPTTAEGDYSWVRGFTATRSKWTHVVMSWDSAAKAAALYVDGAIIEQVPYSQYTNAQPTQQEVRIGYNFIGAIDEVRIYDRVLPPAEALLLP